MIPLGSKIFSFVSINPATPSVAPQIQIRNNHRSSNPYRPINFSANRHNPDQVQGIYLQVYNTRGIEALKVAVVQEKIKNYSQISPQDLKKINTCNSQYQLQRELLFEKLR